MYNDELAGYQHNSCINHTRHTDDAIILFNNTLLPAITQQKQLPNQTQTHTHTHTHTERERERERERVGVILDVVQNTVSTVSNYGQEIIS